MFYMLTPVFTVNTPFEKACLIFFVKMYALSLKKIPHTGDKESLDRFG